MLVAVICITSCVSCGFASCGDGSESSISGTVSESAVSAPPDLGSATITPTLPPVDEWYLDYYHVKFVYRYYTVFINEAKRMELKSTDDVLLTLYIPLDNDGFTAEQQAKIANIAYTTGMTIDGWHLGWNSIAKKVSGEAYDFSSGEPVKTDLTLYLDRGAYAGDNASYELLKNVDGTMTLAISGSGKMFDFEEVNGVSIPWYENRNKITKVVVGDGITYIGKNAFNGLSKATELVLPDSITEIGDYAFYGWEGLKTFTSPASLKTIGSSAFAGTGLTFLRLTEGVENIKDSAFSGSNKIATIHIPSTLKSVGTSAFHPGTTNNVVNESYIKYVYSHGTKAQFENVEIGLDNSWFHELSLLYFVLEDGQDPYAEAGPYWREVNGTPVPYYFMINYYLPGAYGLKVPVFTDYARTDYTIARDGTITITAVATAANEQFPSTIVYNNYKFGSFSGAVKAGDILSDAVNVSCVSATSPNKGNLSNNGGIKWEYNSTTSQLVITSVLVANESEVIKHLRTAFNDYTINKDTKITEILGVAPLSYFDVISEVGFNSIDEFLAFASRLSALDIYISSDPLVGTASLIGEAGITTLSEVQRINKIVSELGIVSYDKADAIIAILEKAGVDSVEEIDALIESEEIPAGVTLADLQQISADCKAASLLTGIKESVSLVGEVMQKSGLDSVGLSDFATKLTTAEINGNIAEEFESIQARLAQLEEKDFNLSDTHSKYLARVEAMKDFAAITIAEFAAGDYEAYNASDMTVGDVASYIMEAQVSEKVFKIWSFRNSKDTIAMWGSSVKSIIIRGNIEHIGSYTFSGLSNIESIDIPATVKSMEVSSFDGCGNLHSIYYDGTSLADCTVITADGTISLADVTFGGTKAEIYAKAEAATGEDGQYWIAYGDDRIAWSLSDGTLTIGGPAVMYNFNRAEDAPWYPAKDSITAITISTHITSVGENIANGYSNVNAISFLGKAVKNIAASAFSGTKFLLDYDNYDDGLLIVNDYLLAAKTDAAFLEIPFYTVLVAGGALENCPNLTGLYIPRTIQNINSDVFANRVPYLLYYDGTSTQWEMISEKLQFPEGATYYVALEKLRAGDEEKYHQFDWNDDNECYLTSCIHEWTEWNIVSLPSCSKTGLRTHSCNGVCQAKDVEDIIPALGHTWSEWQRVEDDPYAKWHVCTLEDCDDPENKGYEVSAADGFIDFKDFDVIADGTEIVAGTDKYFTVILSTYSKIDGAAGTFVTGEEGETESIIGRLYFGQDPVFANKDNGTVAKNLIKFTTTGAASVKVYWTHNWNASREMAVFTADGKVIAKTEARSTGWGQGYVSTLEIGSAGEYYLGALENHTNAIFKLEVTEGDKIYTLNVGEDLERTALWSSASTTDVVVSIGNNTSTNAHVVEVDGEKYFHYERIGNTSSGTHIKFSNNTLTPVDGQSIVFELYMNQKHIGNSTNSAYFKFMNANGDIRGDASYWFYGAEGNTNGSLSFKSRDASIAFTNIAPEGEWFALRFVFTAQNMIQIWVKTDMTSDNYVLKGEFEVAKAYEIRQIQIQSDASMIHSTDIKAAGFTLIEGTPVIDPEAPDENGRLPDANDQNDSGISDELVKLPVGTVIFGDINGGTWKPQYTDSVKIALSDTPAAEARVVRWKGNKYLEYSKFATDAISALSFTKTKKTVEGEPTIFRANIKYNHISAADAVPTIKLIDAERNEYAAIALSALAGDALGYVRFNGESIGIKEDTWFTLTFKITSGVLEIYVDGYRMSITEIEGVENVSSVTIDGAESALFKLDLDNVYFGGDFEEYKEEGNREYYNAPLGTVVFGNLELGKWNASNTSDVEIKVSHEFRANATVLQDENGNSYLEYIRTSTSGAAYIDFRKTENTWPTDPIIFETKIRHSHLSDTDEASYFRFFGADGTEYKIGGALYFFSAVAKDNKGNVKLGGLDTGVIEDEWFTLKFVFTANTIEVLINGVNLATYTVEGIENVAHIRLASDDVMKHRTDFDDVYFGSEIYEYPSEDSQVSGGNSVQLLPGAVPFDDFEVGPWSTSFTTDLKIAVGDKNKCTVEVVKENDNQFLRYQRIKHTSSGTGISFTTAQSIAEGQLVAFETKMRSWHLSSSMNCSYFYIQNANGGRINTATMWFSASSGEDANGEWKVSYNNGAYKVDLGVFEGEWFDLRIIATPDDILEFWTAPVGEELVKRGEIPLKGCSKMRMITLQSDAGMIHRTDFDNVYLGEFIPDTAGDTPLPKDETNLAPGTVTMAGLKDGKLPYEINYVKGDSASTLGAVMVTRANKVLEFNKIEGSDPYFYLSATEKNVAANKTVFKTQMMFGELEKNGYMDFTLMPGGASAADRVFKLRVAVTEDGKVSLATVTLEDGKEVVSEALVSGVSINCWFTLRIEYTEEDGQFKVFVDRKLALTSTTPYSVYKDAAAISKVAVNTDANLAGKIYFDNMSLSQLIVE